MKIETNPNMKFSDISTLDLFYILDIHLQVIFYDEIDLIIRTPNDEKCKNLLKEKMLYRNSTKPN